MVRRPVKGIKRESSDDAEKALSTISACSVAAACRRESSDDAERR